MADRQEIGNGAGRECHTNGRNAGSSGGFLGGGAPPKNWQQSCHTNGRIAGAPFEPGTQNFSFLFFGKFELRAACIYNQSQLGFFAGGFDGEPGAP